MSGGETAPPGVGEMLDVLVRRARVPFIHSSVESDRELCAARAAIEEHIAGLKAEVTRLEVLFAEIEDWEVDFAAFDDVLPATEHVHASGETEKMNLIERIEWVVERMEKAEAQLAERPALPEVGSKHRSLGLVPEIGAEVIARTVRVRYSDGIVADYGVDEFAQQMRPATEKAAKK